MFREGEPGGAALTAANAMSDNWKINWIGVRPPPYSGPIFYPSVLDHGSGSRVQCLLPLPTQSPPTPTAPRHGMASGKPLLSLRAPPFSQMPN
jgi:hypothetical protein